MKIFAKACLRGAVENIYDYVQYIANVEESQVKMADEKNMAATNVDPDEVGQATILKVLKFKRALLFGGLQQQRNVNGIDAHGLVLTLEQQKNRNKRLENEVNGLPINSDRPDINADVILEVLNKSAEKNDQAKVAFGEKDFLKMLPEKHKVLFQGKTPFSTDLYEGKIVEEALENDHRKKGLNLVIDQK